MSRANFYKWQNMFKGVSNHRRIEMLFWVDKNPGVGTAEVISSLKINYQTGASHMQKLVRSGLLLSYRKGIGIGHWVSPLGKSIIRLLIKQ